MQSRLETGRGPARLRAGPTNRTTGELAWHQRWLALDDHRLRLLDAWCDLQRRLEGRAGWSALSEEARVEAERASGLSDIDANLRFIHRRLRRWLRALPTELSHDVEGVAANLCVAQRLLAAEENPVVHGLISRAVRDLTRMQDVS